MENNVGLSGRKKAVALFKWSLRKNLPFLIWLTEYNPTETLSPEDTKSRKYILKLLYKNLELFDSDN